MKKQVVVILICLICFTSGSLGFVYGYRYAHDEWFNKFIPSYNNQCYTK